jgi:hypothetical protein
MEKSQYFYCGCGREWDQPHDIHPRCCCAAHVNGVSLHRLAKVHEGSAPPVTDEIVHLAREYDGILMTNRYIFSHFFPRKTVNWPSIYWLALENLSRKQVGLSPEILGFLSLPFTKSWKNQEIMAPCVGMILPNIWNVICQVTFQTTNQVLVSWDDDIPNIWKNTSHVPNHQSVTIFV